MRTEKFKQASSKYISLIALLFCIEQLNDVALSG